LSLFIPTFGRLFFVVRLSSGILHQLRALASATATACQLSVLCSDSCVGSNLQARRLVRRAALGHPHEFEAQLAGDVCWWVSAVTLKDYCFSLLPRRCSGRPEQTVTGCRRCCRRIAATGQLFQLLHRASLFVGD
jgi:hypothetical protein